MLRNRKTPPPLDTLSENEWKHAELVFDLYIVKKWYYVGGNHDSHWKYFTILCKNQAIPKREDLCDLCQRPMNPYRIYYIKQYDNDNGIKQIGRCCYWRYDIVRERQRVMYSFQRVKQKMD